MNRRLFALRMFLVVFVIAAFSVSVVARAEATAPPVDAAEIHDVMQALKEVFTREPHLENFGTDSPALKTEIERGLGTEEWLNQEYAGRPVGDIVDHYNLSGLDTEAKSIMDGYEQELANAADAAPEYGVAETAVGGEALDAASLTVGTASLTSAAAIGSGIAGTVLATGAAVTGFVIGERVYELFTGSPYEVVGSEPTFTGGFSVEAEAWQRIYVCPAHCWESLGDAFHGEGIYAENYIGNDSSQQVHTGYSTGAGTPGPPVPVEAGQSFYILAERSTIFEGTDWYGTQSGYTTRKTKDQLWPYAEPSTEDEGDGCEHFGNYVPTVAGWPPHLKKTQLSFSSSIVEECTPTETDTVTHVTHNKPYKEITGTQIAVWRKAAQMPVTFGRKRACRTGISCRHMPVDPLPGSASELGSKLKAAFPGGEKSPHHDLEKWIDHETGGGGGKVPNVGETTVPNCIGTTGTDCAHRVETAELVPELDILTWEAADVTKPANAVISTSPPGTSPAKAGDTVKIVVNPGALPLTVPTISPNELYTSYKARLESAGFTDVSVETLPESAYSPAVGPNDVVRVNPDQGTRVDPSAGATTPVEIIANPATAPAVGEPPVPGIPGGTTCGLTPPSASIDTTPITSAKFGSIFPFSMVVFAKEALVGLVTTPQRPNQAFFVFGNNIGDLSFLSHFDSALTVWRDVVAFLITVGAALFLWRKTLGS